MKYVSFYADIDGDDYYSHHAQRISRELDNFGLEHYIVNKGSGGNYQGNCLSKPDFMVEMFDRLREPFVWLDIDTFMLKYPSGFDELLEMPVDIGFASSSGTMAGMKASPVFVNNTPAAYDFLKSWKWYANANAEADKPYFDHELLFKLIPRTEGKLEIGYLHGGYCLWPEGTPLVSALENHTYNDEVLRIGFSGSESKCEGLKKLGSTAEAIAIQTIEKR